MSLPTWQIARLLHIQLVGAFRTDGKEIWPKSDPQKICGINPLTGLDTCFYFNEPMPNRKSILHFHIDKTAWYSEDAGLTWRKINDISEVINQTDVVIN
jgi:hypothetical protein